MLKEDDLVLCTVRRIEGTTVFLDIDNDGEGSLVMSEIAAGRIRNLREYVAPNKRIVCKVLKIINGHPQLSLRRVTGKEREQVLEENQKEKTFISLIKTIVKNPQETLDKIRSKYELWKFYDDSKEDHKLLGLFFSEEDAAKLSKIFSEKRDKEKISKKIIKIQSFSDSGVEDIKSILQTKEADIRYLGSSNFSISVKGKDFKDINTHLNKLIEEMQHKAKEKKAILELIE